MFSVGDKVKHKKYGVGEVKTVHNGAVPTYDVNFPFPVGYEYGLPESKLTKADDQSTVHR